MLGQVKGVENYLMNIYYLSIIIYYFHWWVNKLKSLNVAKWRKDDWRMMKDDDFKLLRGFDDEQTDRLRNRHLWVTILTEKSGFT